MIRAFVLKVTHRFIPELKSRAVIAFSRLSLANPLLTSISVPHQMATFLYSLAVRRAAADVACAHQSGMMPLVSQNALSVFISLFEDHIYGTIALYF